MAAQHVGLSPILKFAQLSPNAYVRFCDKNAIHYNISRQKVAYFNILKQKSEVF